METVNYILSVKVAMAQGKQGIWMFIFPDRENTGNLPKILKNVFTQGIYFQRREHFRAVKFK